MSSENKLNIGASDEERARFIAENESSVYGGINEEGEDVLVFLVQGVYMDVKTYQKNGWMRVDEYFEEGVKVSESYEGRWK